MLPEYYGNDGPCGDESVDHPAATRIVVCRLLRQVRKLRVGEYGLRMLRLQVQTSLESRIP
jgi:hypothetical protein